MTDDGCFRTDYDRLQSMIMVQNNILRGAPQGRASGAPCCSPNSLSCRGSHVLGIGGYQVIHRSWSRDVASRCFPLLPDLSFVFPQRLFGVFLFKINPPAARRQQHSAEGVSANAAVVELVVVGGGGWCPPLLFTFGLKRKNASPRDLVLGSIKKMAAAFCSSFGLPMSVLVFVWLKSEKTRSAEGSF